MTSQQHDEGDLSVYFDLIEDQYEFASQLSQRKQRVGARDIQNQILITESAETTNEKSIVDVSFAGQQIEEEKKDGHVSIVNFKPDSDVLIVESNYF